MSGAMAKADKPKEVHAPRDRRRLLGLAAVALLGAAVAAWLVRVHLALAAGESGGACGLGGPSGCDAVNSSRFASLLGVPIAYLGLAFYVGLLVSAVFDLRSGKLRTVAYARSFGALAVLYSLFLAGMSLFVLRALCVFCAALYGINVVIFILGWWRAPKHAPAALGALSGLLRRLTSFAGLLGVLLFVLGAVGLATAEGHLRDAAARASGSLTSKMAVVAQPGHTSGAPDAAVSVLVFSDFQCPFCRRAAGEVEALRQRHDPRVLLAFKHFPLDPACNRAIPQGGHHRACAAAVAAVCAGQQGRFWEFHDAVFAVGTEEAQLEEAAAKAGLDLASWRACRASDATVQAVRADIEQGITLGVRGTPTFIVGNRVVPGVRSVDELLSIVDEQATVRAGL